MDPFQPLVIPVIDVLTEDDYPNTFERLCQPFEVH
jgi:hypothetical protein